MPDAWPEKEFMQVVNCLGQGRLAGRYLWSPPSWESTPLSGQRIIIVGKLYS